MSSNTVLLHCHIFKNGGTTIDACLTKNFGSAAIFIESPDGNFLSPGRIIETCKKGGQVHSISSHKIGLPPPKHERFKFCPLIMVREPLDRVGSIYSFYNRLERDISHECAFAKRNSFRVFVKTLLDAGLDSSFSNLQAQFFLKTLPTEENWSTVVENINDEAVDVTLELPKVSAVNKALILPESGISADVSLSGKTVKMTISAHTLVAVEFK